MEYKAKILKFGKEELLLKIRPIVEICPDKVELSVEDLKKLRL